MVGKIVTYVALFSALLWGCQGTESPSEPSWPNHIAGRWAIYFAKAVKIENTYVNIAVLDIAEREDIHSDRHSINGIMTIGTDSVLMNGFVKYSVFTELHLAGSYRPTEYSLSTSRMADGDQVKSLDGVMVVTDRSVSPSVSVSSSVTMEKQ